MRPRQCGFWATAAEKLRPPRCLRPSRLQVAGLGCRLPRLRQLPYVIFKLRLGNAFLRAYVAFDRYSRFNHACLAPGDQGMPPGERLATGQATIRATFR